MTSITIYNPTGEAVHEAPITKDARVFRQLGGDYYVEVPFSVADTLALPNGSYILVSDPTTSREEKYALKRNATPEPISGVNGYKYVLKFYSRQHDMEACQIKWLAGGSKELSFRITTSLRGFAQLIADNMNEYLGFTDDTEVTDADDAWLYDDTLDDTDMREQSFEGVSCWDAINSIANLFGVEWWIDHGRQLTIRFGKCENGEKAIPIIEGEIVNRFPAPKRGDDSNYGTRFYIFGGSQNVPDTYNPHNNASVDSTTFHIAEKRICLRAFSDTGQDLGYYIPYFDAIKDLPQAEIVEKTIFLNEVFPKNETIIGEDDILTQEENIIEGEDKQPVYYIKVFEEPKMLSTLGITFTSGALSGRSFGAAYTNSYIKVLYTTENRGGASLIAVPNANLAPKAGDKYILTGVELDDGRIKAAERELWNKGTELARQYAADTNVYDCPVNEVYCTKKEVNLALGNKVILKGAHFGENGRYSRIQGYEKKLYNPYIATYNIGDNSVYSRTAKVIKDIYLPVAEAATNANGIALEAKAEATKVNGIALEAKEAATNANGIALEAKAEATKVNGIALEAKEAATNANGIALEAKAEALEAKELQASTSSDVSTLAITLRGTEEDISSDITLFGGRAYAKEQAEMLLGKDADSIKNTTTLKGLKSYIQKVCNQFVDGNDNVINMLFYGGAADTNLIAVNVGAVLSFVPNNNFLTRYTIHADDVGTHDGQKRVRITTDNYTRYPGTIVYINNITEGYDAGLGFSLSVGDMILATERGWKKIGGDNDYIRSLTINGISKAPDANGNIEFGVVDAIFINEYSADDFIGVDSIAIDSDFYHKVQSAIRDGKLLYIKSFEDATLGYVPFLVEEDDWIYYTIYTATGTVISGDISEEAITVYNVKNVGDIAVPFFFHWYTLGQMWVAYQNSSQLNFDSDAFDALERAIRNNAPILIGNDVDAGYIQLNVRCGETISLSAIDSSGGLITAEVYRDKIIVNNYARIIEDISTLKNSLPYSTEFSYEELIDAANNGLSIKISNSIFEAIDLNRRIIIPIVESRSYYNVRQASYSAGDGFTYRTAELEIAIGDSIKRFILNFALATDGYIANVSYIDTKLCASTEFKTIFGDSIIGEGDVLGDYSLEIQNTGTYNVEAIANARIVRSGGTFPIDFDVETHIGNGPSVYVTLSQSGELQVRGTIGGVYLTYLANGTIQEDFIPSTIARTADIKQSDWNEEDSSSNAYINNRTHYFQPYTAYSDLSTYNTAVGENFGTVGEYFSLGGYIYKSSNIVGQEFNCAPYGPSVIVSVVVEIEDDYELYYLKFVSGSLSSGIPIPFCGAGFAKQIDEVYIPDTIARYSNLKTINGQTIEGTGNIEIQASGEGAKWEVRDVTYTSQFTTSITITNRVNPITDKVYYKATATATNVAVNSILPVQGSMTECKIFIPSAGTSLAAMTVSVNQGITAYWETPKTVTGGAPCELTLRVVTGSDNNSILLLALKELTIENA